MTKSVYVLIGPQGSGKTYWAKNVLTKHKKDIVRISQDDQGRQGHRDLFSKCIREGRSVVVDRMNFNFEQRDRYTRDAYANGYDVVYVWFNITKDICLRRLATRKDHPTIAPDADHSGMLDFYFCKFEKPSCQEYDDMFTIGLKGHCCMLDLRPRCFEKRVIVVGDIHGCFDEFTALLDKCEYIAEDIVVATGDLVDRGPKIKETLRWFRDTPGAYTVMGNHDNKLMRYWKGNPVKIANGLDNTIEQCHDLDPTPWAAWLQSIPQMIRLCDVDNKPMYVVHAGVDGRRPIEQQRTETCLYVRHLDGKDFLDQEGGIPWWDTLSGEYTVASGHIITEHVRPNESAFCLDGGAYQGGELRALVLNGDIDNICKVVSNITGDE